VTHASLWSLRRSPGAPPRRLSAQRRPMRMMRDPAPAAPIRRAQSTGPATRTAPSLTRRPIGDPGDLRSVLTELVLVDLPVDVVVVLEQQERADQGERTVRPAHERGWSALGEHVFVTIRRCADGRARTYVRVRS
jgi:hypothetical protein